MDRRGEVEELAVLELDCAEEVEEEGENRCRARDEVHLGIFAVLHREVRKFGDTVQVKVASLVQEEDHYRDHRGLVGHVLVQGENSNCGLDRELGLLLEGLVVGRD